MRERSSALAWAIASVCFVREAGETLRRLGGGGNGLGRAEGIFKVEGRHQAASSFELSEVLRRSRAAIQLLSLSL